nr:MAG TPA: hypothetical protein [Caudoviricetes sp.]
MKFITLLSHVIPIKPNVSTPLYKKSLFSMFMLNL